MGEYLLIVCAVLGHDVGAVLAHADAVAVAGYGEEKAVWGVVQGEGGGAQLEESAQLRAGDLRAPYVHRLDAAGCVMHGGAEPVGRVTLELGLGVEGLDGAFEVLGADAEGADVVRHVLGSLGAVHADEVGLGLPDGGG